ncbi:MAG: RagB/SusD family nutrient uptake outer membrane protein, partial [Ferruginibacter sp.]|nr:RagB/SusD family nutrient uptake outer membrane protein [Ferruginibacter sp.]
MKKIKFFSLVIICLVVLGSCKKNFLDKAPGVDLTEESVFKTRVALDQFIATTYGYAMHSVFRYRFQGNIPFSGVSNTDCVHPSTTISDEGDASDASFVHSNRWNEGTILPTNIVNNEDFRYFIRWIAIRQINLILKRINEVPDADAAYKKQVIAEMKFLRAMNYFEMLKRYGGMPIVIEIYEPGVPINAPRNTFEECVNFSLKDVNEAISDLPSTHPSALTGRTTAMAAHALKAKILLFAASPQYNTANPIISMTNNSDNKLICYGNFDANRWRLAIDAFKAALDYAAANGYSIVDVPANRNPNELNNGTVGPLGNYRESWENPNNPEIILKYQFANLAGGVTNSGNAPMAFINASCFGSSWS